MTRRKVAMPIEPEPEAEPVHYRKVWPGAVWTIVKELGATRVRAAPIQIEWNENLVIVNRIAYNHLIVLLGELEQAVARDRKQKRVGVGVKK